MTWDELQAASKGAGFSLIKYLPCGLVIASGDSASAVSLDGGAELTISFSGPTRESWERPRHYPRQEALCLRDAMIALFPLATEAKP
jgi:hypothetical protein